MRNLLIKYKISTEKKIWKIEIKIFRKNFHEFFFLQKFLASDFFCINFFSEKFDRFFFYYSALGGERSERRGGVGERSEPPAGGLAVGAEGSVNSELI